MLVCRLPPYPLVFRRIRRRIPQPRGYNWDRWICPPEKTMGLVVVPVVQLFTGREHYTLPDRPHCLGALQEKVASRGEGFGVEFARHNRYNESRQCNDTLCNGSAQVAPLSTCLQTDQLKNVHPGPKQISQYMPWALAQTPDLCSEDTRNPVQITCQCKIMLREPEGIL